MSEQGPPNEHRSPLRKKTKHQNKNRRTYFFQPQNNLAFTPNVSVGPSTYKTKEPTTTVSSFKNQGIEANDGNSKPPNSNKPESLAEPVVLKPDDLPNRVSFAKAMDRSMEQQSSDDSFDGVRWRSDKKISSFTRPILSSPLRRTEIKDTSPLQEPSMKPSTEPSIVNEVTESLLTKYGVEINSGVSQTPKFTRAQSELPHILNPSPSLSRSKSFDPKTITNENIFALDHEKKHLGFSGLNKWIDQFDDTSVPKPIEMMSEITGQHIQVDLPKMTIAVPVDEFDNLSSDDDSFLATLRVDSFPPVVQSEASNLRMTPDKQSSNPKPPSPASEDDADPFSDDLDILTLNTLTTLTSSIPPEPKSTTNKQNVTKKNNNEPFFKNDEDGPEISFSRPDFARYQINSILESTYQHQQFKRSQLILTVTTTSKETTKLIVRGEACGLDLKINDIIHVIHTFPENKKLIDDFHNLLIWNPDILISSTVCADQLYCPRKTVLMKRFSFPGSLSLPLLLGTIVHEIFQICMVNEKFTFDYMNYLLDKEIESRLFEIFSVGDVVEDLKLKARKHFEVLRKWFLQYFKQKPKEVPTNKRHQNVKFSVAEILDIEESVWSPMFGIKGIADVTLKANIEGEQGNGQFLLPMEIKTGQPHLNHQAQSALYSLLFKDRYNIDISSFLLVYSLEDGSTTKHDISIPDLRSLVNLRNRISYYLKPGNQDLPDLMRQQKCERCMVQQSCMTLNYMLEDGTPEESGLDPSHYESITEHLQDRSDYTDFLKHWDNLLTNEEEFMSRVNKELWVMTSKDRESQRGKALGNLVIKDCIDDSTDSNFFAYVFERRKGHYSTAPLNTTQISRHDKIIVSDELGHFALAHGVVKDVDVASITVVTRRRIVPTQKKSDVFHRAKVLLPSQKSKSQDDAVVFRIDKDEFFYGMGVARYNILNLFLEDGDAKRRGLVVELNAPKFSLSPQFLIDSDSEHFNDDQLAALRRISCTQDYCLVLGMPGTGKTTVIAHLIKMLVRAKKSVLLTSYTNSAVDNILLKVIELDVDFIRVGSQNRVHPGVREYMVGTKKKPLNTFKDFERQLMNPLVVAATCLSISDLTFSIRDHFDYCIVDEASQVSMPLSLGPISFCDKFILVGDHFQLPPLVTHPSPDVRKGLSKSLFQLLATAHPQSVVELKHQYRMCEDIMAISNRLVYQNRLVCGSKEVAGQKLAIKILDKARNLFDDKLDNSWVMRALDPKSRVVFFNHDSIPAYERVVGESVTNEAEIELVKMTVEALCACGVNPSSIGIMTLYKSQLKLLFEALKHIPHLEILTADRFQGRDKECVIISMVRSNQEGKTGELLKDWRRINVAVTRARSKLIVFGSKAILSQAESSRGFISLCSERNWIFELSKTSFDLLKESKKGNRFRSENSVGKLSTKSLERHPVLSNVLDDFK